LPYYALPGAIENLDAIIENSFINRFFDRQICNLLKHLKLLGTLEFSIKLLSK